MIPLRWESFHRVSDEGLGGSFVICGEVFPQIQGRPQISMLHPSVIPESTLCQKSSRNPLGRVPPESGPEFTVYRALEKAS
jgi:hypothetical protein